jgi:flagellar biosynthetic protein FlhB
MARREGTEAPTPRRLEKARKEGMVARTPELASWIVILAFAMAAPLLFRVVESQVVGFAAQCLAGGQPVGATTALRSLANALELVGRLALLVVAVVAVLAAAVTVAQVGFRFTPKKLVPSLQNLSPARNLRRIFSTTPATEAAKSAIKLVIVVAVSVAVLASGIGAITAAAASPIATAAAVAAKSLELVRLVGVLGLVLALVDYGRQRTSMRRQLLMTRQEVKDEMRQYEGDLHVKARRRRVARELSRRRMIANIALADVVVANPTHVAVALAYDPERDRAPVVIAKGQELLAATIRAKAREHGVPIVVDPPLARALNLAVEVGDPIPGSLFLVVARLLAFVYQLRGAARYLDARHETRLEELPEELIARI